MGLILDTSIFIQGERRDLQLAQILDRIQIAHPETSIAISAITIIELDHGIYRAHTEARRLKRVIFSEDISRDVLVHPVSIEIAHLAGRIEGQQAALGKTIALADLLIGATALHFGDAVLTFNLRHFQMIPDLTVLTL
jgi:tRNA(fMet)-specific endonuclease VapC